MKIRSLGSLRRWIGRHFIPARYFPASLEQLRVRFEGLDLTRGPVLVLGSAGNSVRPPRFDSHWSLFTANASHLRAVEWGLPPPQLALFRHHAFRRGGESALWGLLKSQRAERVFTPGFPRFRSEVEAVLAAHSYDTEQIILATSRELGTICSSTTGRSPQPRSELTHMTTGLVGVTCALWLGAPLVVISGISFSSTGYFHPATQAVRRHVSGDRLALDALRGRGAPIATSDPQFAAETGLPLWDDDAAERWYADRPR